jgi:hypothetical protein
MAYLVDFPVEGGGTLRVQGVEEEEARGLELAARGPAGLPLVKAKESVQAALDDIVPAITAVSNRLRSMAADEVTIEFGLMLGAEGGAIVAKGKAEVHFTVTFSWNNADRREHRRELAAAVDGSGANEAGTADSTDGADVVAGVDDGGAAGTAGPAGTQNGDAGRTTWVEDGG